MDRGHDSLFAGEPQPIPELDVSTIQEVRKRLLGIIFARQVGIALTSQPDFTRAEPQTDAELISAVRQMDEYFEQEEPLIAESRRIERENLWEFMGVIDELENEALKQHEQES